MNATEFLYYPRRLRQIDITLSQSPWSRFAIAFVTIALFITWQKFPPSISLIMPDSGSYLRFDAFRSAGYPFFLSVLDTFGADHKAVIFLQSVIFFISLYFMLVRFMKTTKTLALSLLLLLGIGFQFALIRFNFTVLTESLFFSSLMVLLGVLLGESSLSPRRLVGIAALIAWMILIKPVAWAFICVPVILIVHQMVKRAAVGRSILALLVGFALVFLAGSGYRYAVHHSLSSGSFLGSQLVGKQAFADFDPEHTPFPDASRRWLMLMAPIKAARDDHMTTLDERFLFSLNAYDYLRFQHMPDILNQSDIALEQRGSAMSALAVAVIAQAPGTYVKDIMTNFIALWRLPTLQGTSAASAYNGKLDAARIDLPEDFTPYRLSDAASKASYIIRPFLALSFAINVLILVVGVWRLLWLRRPLDNRWMALLIAAAMVQSYFLLTALLQAALVRYAIAVWPVHLVITVGACLLYFDRWFEIQIED